MDAAKAAIKKLTSHDGQNTTEVTEHYRPAVTHEQIIPTREHEDTTVLDREIHHEHHHTSVLPVQDQQTLPTEHQHRIGEAKHSEHHHGHHKHVHDKVASELDQFKDQTQIAPTETTRTTAPSIGSEHHHHHVHETIQPVVQKQTIQPSVVHTTIPVHEVHHNEPKHYTASALPAVSMQEFQSQGGSLTGLKDRVERFEGEPDSLARSGHGSSGLTLGTTSSGLGNTGSSGFNDSTTNSGTSALGGGNDLSTAQQGIDSRVDKPVGAGVSSTSGSGIANDTTNTTGQKVSLLDKLNPFKDADGDGKKGVGS